MANLMLFQCVIASHAEVWTCQFWWIFYQELIVIAMVQGQKERQCQLKVNTMSNRKKVMLTKDAPISSHLADYVLHLHVVTLELQFSDLEKIGPFSNESSSRWFQYLRIN